VSTSSHSRAYLSAAFSRRGASSSSLSV
jgi:hypothetical protein